MSDSRPCPRCGWALFEGRSGFAALLGCGRCGGVWIDTAASRAVLEGVGQALAALSEQARVHATVVVDRGPDGLPCPVCAKPLTRGVVPNTAIEIDVCAADGTWLDAGELRLLTLAFAKLPAPMTFSREDYENREDRGQWIPERGGRYELDDRGHWVFKRGGWGALPDERGDIPVEDVVNLVGAIADLFRKIE